MLKQTESGDWIISASEVGEFTICPEAWRLKSLANVEREKSKSAQLGVKLHEEWGRDYGEATQIWRLVRLTFMLLMAAILGMILRLDMKRHETLPQTSQMEGGTEANVTEQQP